MTIHNCTSQQIMKLSLRLGVFRMVLESASIEKKKKPSKKTKATDLRVQTSIVLLIVVM